MPQLTVRNVNEQVVRALKQRAAAHGRSAEAEHRDALEVDVRHQTRPISGWAAAARG